MGQDSAGSMIPHFAARTDWNTHANDYFLSVQAVRRDAGQVWDLTASNPTVCGFEYDAESILTALSRPEGLVYSPEPRGMRAARNAVAQYYRDAAEAAVDPDRIFLTTSTSEAYSYLFRLHCNPGEEVLIAQPSYPLFDFLADLNDIRLVSYPLFYDHGWHLDPAALAARITPATRAVVVVNPNNPTGNFMQAAERKALEQICAARGLALIVDEVFLDYPIAPGRPKPFGREEQAQIAAVSRSFACGEQIALTYVLSGISKVAALPQLKAAWIAVLGPEPAVQAAVERLEVIADTYLSMNAPVQHALPDVLAGRHKLQRQIRERTRGNLDALDNALARQSLVSRLVVEAGWYAILRIPLRQREENAAIDLIRRERVIVHPGYFYGLPDDPWIVVSLLTGETEFREGIERLTDFFNRG